MSEIPMPPSWYYADGRSKLATPDRCPAGHREDHHTDPPVMWLHHAAHPAHPVWEWTCLTCSPRPTVGPGRFQAAPELYDDLSWWHDPEQVRRREYWTRVHREKGWI